MTNMEKRKSKSDGGLKEEKLVLSYNGQSEIVRERKDRKIPRSDRTSGYDVQKCRALILKPASTVLAFHFSRLMFSSFFSLWLPILEPRRQNTPKTVHVNVTLLLSADSHKSAACRIRRVKWWTKDKWLSLEGEEKEKKKRRKKNGLEKEEGVSDALEEVKWDRNKNIEYKGKLVGFGGERERVRESKLWEWWPPSFSLFSGSSQTWDMIPSLSLFLLSISDNFGALLGQLDGLPRTYVSKIDCDILPSLLSLLLFCYHFWSKLWITLFTW